MGFIMIDSKIEEIGLDTYSKTVYQRIVFHARNSKIGHIESLENTAKAVNFSKSKVQASIKILLKFNMIEIKKYGRNKHAIFIIEPSSKWIFESVTTYHSSDSRVVPHNTQSVTTYHSDSTISVTRSIELDVCKKPHTQKFKKPNFKTTGIALAESIRKSFGDRFFKNEIAIEIVTILFDEKISIYDIELITHDIERYRFLTSKLKNDIIEQMKNWPNQKSEFIAKKESNFVTTEVNKDENMVQKIKKNDDNYFNELPKEFKEWFNTLNNSNKTTVNRDLKKYQKDIFINNVMPNYLGYRNFIKRAS